MLHRFPQLRTNRFRLTQFVAADRSKVFEGLSHPEVIRYYGVSYDSPEATQTQMDWYDELYATGTGRWWAIRPQGERDLIGACGFNNWQAAHRRAELGFWLLPAFWRTGVMSEALPVVLDHGFSEMNLHRVEAFVETENGASRGILQKLGFTHEGTMRDCEIKTGRFLSLEVWARLAKTRIFTEKPS
jgi:ribosomal-protein-alanine N-acetyltransferase